MEYARQEYLRWMLIETMGIFWLVAEIAILLMVRAGRGYLDGIRTGTLTAWRPPIFRIVVATALATLSLCIATYGRHWFIPPLHSVIAVSPPGMDAIRALFRQRHREHIIVWSGFVTAWVLLEAVIVYQGCRGYCALRQLLREGDPAK